MLVADSLNAFKSIIPNTDYWDAIDSYIRSAGYNGLKHGEKTDLGNGVTVVYIATDGTNGVTEVLEAHRKFYDVHYTLQGTDIIAFEPLGNCNDIKEEYNEAGDYILFNKIADNKLAVNSGSFCLIAPDTAHMALHGKTGEIQKLVFKIPFTTN